MRLNFITPICDQNDRSHILRLLLTPQTNISNHLIPYKCLLHVRVWPYGISRWGSTETANARTVRAFRAVRSRMTPDGPRYVTTMPLHNVLKIPSVRQPTSTHWSRLHTKTRRHCTVPSSSETLFRQPPGISGRPPGVRERRRYHVVLRSIRVQWYRTSISVCLYVLSFIS